MPLLPQWAHPACQINVVAPGVQNTDKNVDLAHPPVSLPPIGLQNTFQCAMRGKGALAQSPWFCFVFGSGGSLPLLRNYRTISSHISNVTAPVWQKVSAWSQVRGQHASSLYSQHRLPGGCILPPRTLRGTPEPRGGAAAPPGKPQPLQLSSLVCLHFASASDRASSSALDSSSLEILFFLMLYLLSNILLFQHKIDRVEMSASTPGDKDVFSWWGKWRRRAWRPAEQKSSDSQGERGTGVTGGLRLCEGSGFWSQMASAPATLSLPGL